MEAEFPGEFDFHHAFDGLFCEAHGRIVSALAKEFRDLELAEDALQEALEVAARKWSSDGIPDNAAGWLYVVARRKAIDWLRREARQRKGAMAEAVRFKAVPPADSGISAMYGIHGPPDERLSLIFACCHPVINEAAQIALTLHTLTGIRTKDIAACFVQKESAVAQRIVRAKRKIKEAGVPFAIPDIENSPDRLRSVFAVIYLIFNTGYTAHFGQKLLKTNLCDEAIFLSRMLMQHIPENFEIRALLALLLFQDSRRNARVALDGSPVLLDNQDRSLWDHNMIKEAVQLINPPGAHPEPGPYLIQAQIAAMHATSPSPSETRWDEILRLYDMLISIYPTSVVILNRAVALSKAAGPAEAL